MMPCEENRFGSSIIANRDRPGRWGRLFNSRVLSSTWGYRESNIWPSAIDSTI